MSIRDELEDVAINARPDLYGMSAAIADVVDHLAERGMVVLGPDGPIDMRPALRALGQYAGAHRGGTHKWLMRHGVPGPLADACLAAAEVEAVTLPHVGDMHGRIPDEPCIEHVTAHYVREWYRHADGDMYHRMWIEPAAAEVEP